MALTYKESALVRASVPILREHGETVSHVCYGNLLRAHPELNNLFNPTNQANGRQPRAFTAVILAFAANINHTSELIPRFERMCNKHCSLGIRPEHYDVVGKFLLQAFAQILGSRWNPNLHAAWSKAYSMLARMLMTREQQMYGEFGNWKSWRNFRIDRKVIEGDRIFSLYLVPADGQRLPAFLPGQYVTLRMKVPTTGRFQLRQYSLSDVPYPDHYRITVKRVQGDKISEPGVVSSLLDDRQVGDIVEISHPTGDFHVNPAPSSTPLVLISAGIGATPMVPILNSMHESRQNRPISWIHCSAGKAPFEDHVRQLASENRNLQVKFFRSRVTTWDDVDQSEFSTGRLDLAGIVDRLHLDHRGTEYYICGPETLMEDITRFLSVQEVDRGRIKCEIFSTGDLEFKTYGI